jgi:long-chain fatty acid transport protein
MKFKTSDQQWPGGGWSRLGIAVLLVVAGTVASAEGFRNATIGAWDLGRSGGRIAQVDDATAVQHNPANMLNATNAELQFTPSVIYIHVDYNSPDGSQSAETTHPWKALPNFFAVMPLENDRVAVGLGVSVPFGLANEWRTTSSAFQQPAGGLTYMTPFYSRLITVNVNPSVAVKLNDQLRVGAGLDVMWSDLEFKQYLYSGAPPAIPDLYAQAEGDGVGIGGNLGITWLLTENQSIALAYRSTMTVDYSGNTDFHGYPGSPSTSFNSQIKYPNIISAGYGIKLNDAWRMEADVEWLQFSMFKNLPINVGNNPLGVPSQNISEKWHNTFTAGLGTDWQINDRWVVRGGYQYFESPVPNSTFTPSIPDSNQNVVTLGLGWKGRHSSFEVAYGLDFYNDRNITDNQNPAFNGTYKFNVHLFSLAYRYSF